MTRAQRLPQHLQRSPALHLHSTHHDLRRVHCFDHLKHILEKSSVAHVCLHRAALAAANAAAPAALTRACSNCAPWQLLALRLQSYGQKRLRAHCFARYVLSNASRTYVVAAMCEATKLHAASHAWYLHEDCDTGSLRPSRLTSEHNAPVAACPALFQPELKQVARADSIDSIHVKARIQTLSNRTDGDSSRKVCTTSAQTRAGPAHETWQSVGRHTPTCLRPPALAGPDPCAPVPGPRTSAPVASSPCSLPERPCDPESGCTDASRLAPKLMLV